jgi:hypothetical protein
MLSIHFSQRTLEKFLRAELSRPENTEVVRHLLAQCRICQDTMRAAALQQGFEVLEGAPAEADLPLAARLG